ncbi:MAG TPA: hypothetical protein VK491_11120 [Gemmatimonadaceae bacterium]|nr:hypothetical protein [Gemmatimonadaceae bacterium]
MSRRTSFSASLLDQLLEIVEIVVAPAIFVHANHRRHRGAGGVVEEGPDEMAYGGLADSPRIRRGEIDVTRTILLVAEMTLLSRSRSMPRTAV